MVKLIKSMVKYEKVLKIDSGRSGDHKIILNKMQNKYLQTHFNVL